MKNAKDHLIVALDVETLEEAKEIVHALGDSVQIYKVGHQLFTICGTKIIGYLANLEKKIFLDLKYHDIPNTVAHAVKSAVGLNKVFSDEPIILCTLHTSGGAEMMREASAAAKEQSQKLNVRAPKLVGVTVLTSDVRTHQTDALILERAKLAKSSGLDGVVASSEEAAMLRRECGNDFILVTPGIRPAGEDAGDQKRVTTPAQAIQNGSDYLVVGRPIVKADQPSQAADMILNEISGALRQS